MILVFDLGGPLLAYSLLRSAGMSAVAALVISGVLPALGIGISALADRRLDVIGIVVLAGLLAGTLLGLTSHNARLYLLEGSVPSAVFALGCLAVPGFRRAFRDHRGAGVAYLVEAAIRVAIVVTTSTGIALVCSKLIPYVFAVVLSAWTLVYGEHEKKKAERLASAEPTQRHRHRQRRAGT